MEKKPFDTKTQDGVKLVGELFLPSSKEKMVIVPLCHGIPREQRKTDDAGYIPLAERLVTEGFGALIFNFRGCGMSGGDFDILGWGRDLLAVTDALSRMTFTSAIVPWGFSGGASATVWAMVHDQRIKACALFACPADFKTLRSIPLAEFLVEYFRKVGIIRSPDFPVDVKKWLNGFEEIMSEKYISQISPRPLIIVHGDADETVPVEHAYRLFKLAKEPKQLKIIAGAPHRLRESPEAIETAIAWLKDITSHF